MPRGTRHAQEGGRANQYIKRSGIEALFTMGLASLKPGSGVTGAPGLKNVSPTRASADAFMLAVM